MSKRILVTGAAGFIGFHLSGALKDRGDFVLGFDNFNEYYSHQLKENRERKLEEKGIEVVRGDVCDYSLLKTAVEKNRITHIAHMAAQAGVRYSLEDPQAYVRSNLDGFVNILELCRHNPAIKLTYASSSSVYGLNSKTPYSVEDRTDRQASFYGATKKSNELFAATYHHLFGISATGLRYFTVYGPWGRPDMAYWLFTDAILEGRTIQLFNHGKMRRDFTYIDDIVEGTVAAIDLEAACEVFNLGNNRPVELMEFVRIIEDAAGKKAQIEYLPMQPGDVVETYAEIEKSRKLLNFSPKTPLKVGIPKFVDWYVSYKGEARR